MRVLISLIGIAACMATSGSVHATTVFPQTFKCPIGGKKFQDSVIGSSFSWGQRPDGKEYGTTPVWPIPECPDNGLPLFKDEFTKSDITQLEPWVLSPEYQSMRATDVQWYRVWWLQQKLGADPAALASSLLRASWQTDEDADRKVRYQSQLVDAVAAVDRAADAQTWFWLNLRAANALRELGRMDDVVMALDRLEQAETVFDDEDERAGAKMLTSGLRQLAEEGNRESEPANLVPTSEAAIVCIKRAQTLTASETASCASAEVRAEITKAKYERDGATFHGEKAIQAMLDDGYSS